MNFERRCWVQVDLDALRHNFAVVKKAAAGTPVIAVVKADAYGHGDVTVACMLAEEGAAGFAVSGLNEALHLRRAGITQPILILGYASADSAAVLAVQGITQCVPGTEYAAALSAAAVAAGVQVKVHIKLDTGMGRLGFPACEDEAAAVAEILRVAALPGLIMDGIFTHFAVADSLAPADVAYTQQQAACFLRTVDALAQHGVTFRVRHCCNSAGIFMQPQLHLDAVRAGVILYGENPSPETVLAGLRPAMQLKAVVAHVKTVPAGQCISYGRTYTTGRQQRLATVTVGYADGYPRALGNCGVFSIHGMAAPIVGRVCMDQTIVDVTDIPGVQLGDEVTVFGGGAADTVAAVAAKTGTINYEILCDVGRRVQRVYLENGKPTRVCDYLLQEEENE